MEMMALLDSGYSLAWRADSNYRFMVFSCYSTWSIIDSNPYSRAHIPLVLFRNSPPSCSDWQAEADITRIKPINVIAYFPIVTITVRLYCLRCRIVESVPVSRGLIWFDVDDVCCVVCFTRGPQLRRILNSSFRRHHPCRMDENAETYIVPSNIDCVQGGRHHFSS